MTKRICQHKLHRTLLINKNVLNWKWENGKTWFHENEISRNIIYTWGRRKRVYKWVELKLRKKEDTISWEWDYLEISSIGGGGGREFVSG